MPDNGSRYFTLTLDSLRAIGGWAAACAERALPLYEARADSDPRPRAAIEGIREFAGGGKRTARLRTLAMAAHAAAREIGDPAAAAAARSAGSAAASAYTHPLADVHQTKHVVGAAAYAALALEIDRGDDLSASDAAVRWALERAPAEAREVLLHMPARSAGLSRLDAILYELDAGIRAGRGAEGASMTTYVILLRGINVGGKNKIPMADLRLRLQELGFEDVTTYIQSGNVILRSDLDAAELSATIEDMLPRWFDLDADKVRTLALDHARFEKVVTQAPEGFGEHPADYRYNVMFLMDYSSAGAMEQIETREGVDAVWQGADAIYFRNSAADASKSRLSKIAQQPMYRSITIRNWNTTTKLLELLEETAGPCI